MAGDRPRAAYLAECFWTGVREADVEALDARIRRVLAAPASDAAPAVSSGSSGEFGGVRYRGSLLVPGDEVVFCCFDGPSSDAVAAVAERARVPFARIVASVRVGASGTGEDRA